MIKGLIGFVIETAIFLSLGTAVFNQMYHEVKMTSLQKVSQGTISLTKLTEKMTGRKSWLDTPSPKNILRGIGKWD